MGFSFSSRGSYKQPSRELLVASYQHLLLALVVGGILSLTPVPSIAVITVTAAQMWRLRLMRREGTVPATPHPRAAWHVSVYYQSAQRSLLFLGSALVLGLAYALWAGLDESIAVTQVAVGVSACVSLLYVGLKYLALRRDPARW